MTGGQLNANRKKWTRKEKKDTPDSATSSGSAPVSTSSDTAPAEDNFETRFEQMVEEIVLPVLPEEEEEDFSSMEDLCSSDSPHPIPRRRRKMRIRFFILCC